MANFLDSRRSAGVSKNEPKRKGIELFWELFSRKFWSYVKLNLLYVLVSIPTIIFYTMLLMLAFYNVLNDTNAIAILIQSIAGAFLLVTIFSGSPCSSGYNYVLRNFVREEHAWVVSDFFEHTKLNFGKSLAAYLIDVIFVSVSITNIVLYPKVFDAMGLNTSTILVAGLFIAMVLFYAMMHSFIWTLMVTFDLKFTQIYRNSLLLSLLAFPRNIGSLALRIGLFVAIYYFIPLLGIVFSLFVLTSAIGLIAQMMAYPSVKKYMLDKTDAGEEEYENTEEDDDDKTYDLGYEPHGPNDIAGLFKNKNKDDDNETV